MALAVSIKHYFILLNLFMRDHLKFVWMLPNALQRAHYLCLQNKYEDAYFLATDLLIKNPDNLSILRVAAVSATEIKKYDIAKTLWQHTVAIHPNFEPAFFGLAAIYMAQDRLKDAVESYQHALRLNPNYAAALYNLGNAYCELKQFNDAEKCFRQVIELQPTWVNVWNNIGFICLMHGRFEEGWKLREVRYDARLESRNSHVPPLPFPKWNGEPLDGKSIVVWDEQGFGDAIQFARYIRLLREKWGAAKITFVCRPELKALFDTLPHLDRVAAVNSGEQLEHHNYWVFLLSVPYFHKTVMETIPSETGYLSVPDLYQKKWKKLTDVKGLKVGLVWRGAAGHMKDKTRSLSGPDMLAPLLGVSGINFFSLQHELTSDEILFLDSMEIAHFGADMIDFSDCAAIISHMDLIISVDTAVIHLAGVIGKPTWALIPFLPDWRWFLDRNCSPWYPELRLFRQNQYGHWTEVIDKLKADLFEYVKIRESSKTKNSSLNH